MLFVTLIPCDTAIVFVPLTLSPVSKSTPESTRYGKILSPGHNDSTYG